MDVDDDDAYFGRQLCYQFFLQRQPGIGVLSESCLPCQLLGESHKETKTYQLLAYLDIRASWEEIGQAN